MNYLPHNKKASRSARRIEHLQAQNSIFSILHDISIEMKYSYTKTHPKQWFLGYVHVPFLPTAVLTIYSKSNTNLSISKFVELELTEFQLLQYIQSRGCQLCDFTSSTYATSCVDLITFDDFEEYPTEVEVLPSAPAVSEPDIIIIGPPLPSDLSHSSSEETVFEADHCELLAPLLAVVEPQHLVMPEYVIETQPQRPPRGIKSNPDLSKLSCEVRLRNMYPLLPIETLVYTPHPERRLFKDKLNRVIRNTCRIRKTNHLVNSLVYDTDDVRNWPVRPRKIFTDLAWMIPFARRSIAVLPPGYVLPPCDEWYVDRASDRVVADLNAIGLL